MVVGNLYIGTSGWSYDFPDFYPNDLPKTRRFDYYGERFNSVEVNATFYSLLKKKTARTWYERSPDQFSYTLKLSRYITHIKRLKGSKKAFRTFVRRVTPLGEKLGPILIQLPPGFSVDSGRLDDFLTDARDVLKDELTTDHPLAIECRHESWFENTNERVQAMNVMRRHNAAIVFAHSSEYPYPADEPLTATFVYFRFHGPRELFSSGYGKKGMESWAKKVNKYRKKGMDVYAYFNNTDNGDAPLDAQYLRDLVS